MNYAGILESTVHNDTLVAVATTTVAGIQGEQLRVLGYGGMSQTGCALIQLRFGSTVKDTRSANLKEDEWVHFGLMGPMADAGTAVSVTTTSMSVAGSATSGIAALLTVSNILYERTK